MVTKNTRLLPIVKLFGNSSADGIYAQPLKTRPPPARSQMLPHTEVRVRVEPEADESEGFPFRPTLTRGWSVANPRVLPASGQAASGGSSAGFVW